MYSSVLRLTGVRPNPPPARAHTHTAGLSRPVQEYPLNLMLFTGMPEKGWKDYYYSSLEELADPNKALARWAKGEDVFPQTKGVKEA